MSGTVGDTAGPQVCVCGQVITVDAGLSHEHEKPSERNGLSFESFGAKQNKTGKLQQD